MGHHRVIRPALKFLGKIKVRLGHLEEYLDIPTLAIGQPYFKALVASMVHKLCNDCQLTPPKWVLDPEFYLEDVYFSGNIEGKERIRLLVESPP